MKSTGLILDMPLNLDTVELPTAYDMSREQAEGVVTNATLAADGKSIVLDGTAYVTVPDATQYDVKTALSAEAWIQKDDLVGNEIILGKWTNTGNQREWFITATEQKLQVNFGDPTDGTSEGSWATDNNVIVAINTWYHAAFTFNAGTLVVYVNGVSVPGAVTSGSVPVSLYNGPADVIIGARAAGVSDRFSGSIAQARIYSHVRTPGQILDSYTAMRKIFGV